MFGRDSRWGIEICFIIFRMYCMREEFIFKSSLKLNNNSDSNGKNCLAVRTAHRRKQYGNSSKNKDVLNQSVQCSICVKN